MNSDIRKKVMSSFCVAALLTMIFSVCPKAAEQKTYVYYDSASKWTEDWTGSANGNDSGLDMYGFTFGGWVNGTLSGGVATFANLNALTATDIKMRSIALKNSGLDADADYTPNYRRFSAKFTIDAFSGHEIILWYGLQIASKEELLGSYHEPIGNYDTLEDALGEFESSDMILYLTNSTRLQQKDNQVFIYPICRVDTSDEISIEYIFDASKVYAVSVNGTYYTRSLNGADIGEGLAVRAQMNLKAIERTSGTNGAEIPGRNTLTFTSYKYEGLHSLVSDAYVGEDETRVPVNSDIKVHFDMTPAYEDIEDYISITDENGVRFTQWTGSFPSDSKCYDIKLNEGVNFDYNTEYTITVSGDILFTEAPLVGLGDYSKTFLTGYAKLSVENLPSEVTNGTFGITADVTNETFTDGKFTAAAALYEKKAGMFSMIEYVFAEHTLPQGNTAPIEIGSFDVPSDGEHFVKVFFTAGEETVADAVVIGDLEPAAGESLAAGAGNITLSVLTTPDNGRVQISGKYTGKINRAIEIKVKDPHGDLAYIDQLSSGETGDFALDFNLIAGSSGGTYRVEVRPAGDEVYTEEFAMDFSAVLPVASNVKISGIPAVGEKLIALYDYFHFAGDADKSEITWYADTKDDGEFEAVGSGAELSVTQELLNHRLKCAVLAVSESGSRAEESILSEAVAITAAPQISNLILKQQDNRVRTVYTYSHILNFEEKGSEFEWYMSKTKNGEYSLIDNDVAFYDVKAADKGKYVKVKVTPHADVLEGMTIEAVGNPVWSEPFVLSYTALYGGGGGSSGGKGKSSGSVVVSAANMEAPMTEKSGEIDFIDVRGHWAENEIFRLYDSGLVKGRSEHVFEPDATITRAEFAAMLVRALRIEMVEYNGEFSDVSKDAWYAQTLAAAKKEGLLLGSDGRALPDEYITREEMAALAVRAYEALSGEIALSGGLLKFDDAADAGDWAIPAISKAKEITLVTGMGGNVFAPKANTTRAQACVIVCRLLDKIDFEALAAAAEEEQEQSKIDFHTEEAADDGIDVSISDDNPLDQFANEENDHEEQ